MSSPGNWIMYHLKDGLERVFIKEELMLIPEDKQLLPDYVQNGNAYPSWIGIANGACDLFSFFWSNCAVVVSPCHSFFAFLGTLIYLEPPTSLGQTL